tara:strand:+ start:4826 stop:6652 length:1827 start_codon:yes stop_codon:yes gene_type:complete
MDTNKLQITELDFDTIKTNLATFLKASSEFSDYNFEGSGMSAILDVLAYNTHYLSFYLNMVANEMFLDSATERDSVVSIAKQLGYLPSSATASAITVTLDMITTDTTNGVAQGTVITIPKHSKFTAAKDGKTYNFVTLNEYTSAAAPSNNTTSFSVTGVKIHEGTWISTDYITDPNNVEQRFLLAKNTDLSSLTVEVLASATSSTSTKYTQYSDISTLTSTSTHYFLEEVESGQYRVRFGDGVFGKKLDAANVVRLGYLVTSGNGDANNIGAYETSSNRAFTITSPISNIGTTVVKALETKEYTKGGKAPETVDSIKFLAPKSFQTQKRIVTVNDYKTYITNNYANADSVMVWGGEDNDPPQYGKVFVSVKPTTGLTLTDTDKNEIKTDILSKNKVLCIQTEIVDPDYTFIVPATEVKYSESLLLPSGTLEKLALNAIKDYNTNNLGVFSGVFRFSKLVSNIDDVDNAVKSNYTALRLRKQVTPSTDTSISDTWTLKFNSPFVKGSLLSDRFVQYGTTTTVYYTDNSAGVVQLKDVNNVVVVADAGTVDYNTGTIKLNAVNVGSITTGYTYLDFRVGIDQIDVIPKTGQILLINDADITVTSALDTAN